MAVTLPPGAGDRSVMPEPIGDIEMPADTTTTVAPAARMRLLPGLQLTQLAMTWAVPAGLVLLWELAARGGLVTPHVMPAPSRVLATGWELAQSGELGRHLVASLARASIGFVIGGAVGFALGVAVGISRLAQTLLDRSVQMVRAIPFLALLPLVIVWFGVGEGAKIFLVALAVVFPIYINTVLGWPAIVRRIILPGAMPSVLTGVRYALAQAWLALIIAETLATTRGIGFLAMDAREFLQTDVILLTIVIYSIVGVGADALARLLERRLLAWHPNYAEALA
jgi:sulfonate transport system permease protein